MFICFIIFILTVLLCIWETPHPDWFSDNIDNYKILEFIQRDGRAFYKVKYRYKKIKIWKTLSWDSMYPFEIKRIQPWWFAGTDTIFRTFTEATDAIDKCIDHARTVRDKQVVKINEL